jgi:hypothetical protein
LADSSPAVEIAPGIYEQTLRIHINQKLSRGDLEQVLSLGVRAMHEARGQLVEVVAGKKLRGARGRAYRR